MNDPAIMPTGQDHSERLREAVAAARKARTPLRIRGGDSKAFYGRATPPAQALDLRPHHGIVRYQPTELVITARAGTPVSEIERVLQAQGQMLAFDPPRYSADTTLGGAIAAGLAGPGRAYYGGVRDHLLGARCINGEAKVLRFGGEVVKNVAGFDAFRLMSGAMGTLGVLLDLSLKVLPRPEQDLTVSVALPGDEALRRMVQLAARPLPVTASCYDGERLYLRLSGHDREIEQIAATLGYDRAPGDTLWTRIRDHRHPFFQADEPLWRLSVPPATPPLRIVGQWLIEWGGAQRWLRTALPPKIIRETAQRAGGHATLFRGGERDGAVFHPLPAPLFALHKRLKQAFDPYQLLNPGRLYSGL